MRRFGFWMTTLAACAVLGAACSGGDDDDDSGTPSPSPSGTGIPITGTLTTAHGMNAPLVGTDGTVGGNDLVLAAALDGASVSANGAVWQCFMPDPPSFPNYDLIATDETDSSAGTFLVAAQIAPSAWQAGAVTIDDSTVRLYVDNRDDRYGFATGGTLQLVTAPTTSGQTCSFTTGDLSLAGERFSSFAPVVLPGTARLRR